MQGTRCGDMGRLLEELEREATLRLGVPEAEASRAATATMRRLAGAVDVTSGVGRSRVAAYFWAVVRRRAFSGAPGLSGYRDRCVAASLVEDMRSAGHGDESVSEMLRSLASRGSAFEQGSVLAGARLF